MARPAEYDRDEAISKSIRVFARHGYEAASTSALLEGMGIARQSLYGAFGDKRRLFLKALERYSSDSLDQIRSALALDAAVAAIESALLVGLGSCDDIESGCLGVSSIVEFGRDDPDVNALNDKASEAVVESFAARVRQGMATGELKPSIDPDSAGRMLLMLRSGLKVAARGGAQEAELRAAARLALSGLTTSQT